MFKRDLFDPDHDALRRRAAAFLDAEIVPHHDRWTKAQRTPADAWRAAGASGLLCRTIPERYGGHGRDFRDSVVVIEELAKRRLQGLPLFLASDILAPLILRTGTPAQCARFLPGLCSGEAIGAVAITEPQSGSDLDGLRTRAEPEGDAIVVTGEKTHISNGSTAHLVLVAARSPVLGFGGRPGYSLVMVEASTPGLTRTAIDKAGMRALETSDLRFQACRVPAHNLLGGDGAGFVPLIGSLGAERLVVSIYAQSAAEAMLCELIRACDDRRVAACAVLDYQNTQFQLAELYAACAANRAFVDARIVDHLQGRVDPRAACVAKLRTTELAKAIATLSIQLRGASGVSGRSGERAAQDLIDAAAQTIWGGSSEVMRDVIGKSLRNVL